MNDQNLLILAESLTEPASELFQIIEEKEKEGGYCTLLLNRKSVTEDSSPHFIRLIGRLLEESPPETAMLARKQLEKVIDPEELEELIHDFPSQSWVELAGKKPEKRKSSTPEQLALFRKMIRLSNESFDLSRLQTHLDHYLPKLDIHCCSLFIFESTRTGGMLSHLLPPDEARRVYSLEGAAFSEERLFFGEQGLSLLRWVPQNCHRLLMPLSFENDILGFMLMEYRTELPLDFYEDFRLSLGTFMKGQSLKEELHSLSLYDSLTEIYNLRGFYTLGEQMIRQSRRMEVPISLFYCDIDSLGKINQHRGREGGDRVLKDTAGMLHTLFRKNDVVARVGADEFAILAMGISQENEEKIRDRMHRALEDQLARQDEAISFTMRISVSRLNTGDPYSLRELLTMTDYLMEKDETE